MTIASASMVAAPIACIYKTNEQFFAKALDGLSEEELWARPMDNCNPMLWIAGHVAEIRTMVLKLMGETFDTQWGVLFDRGALLVDRAAYPSTAEVRRMMGEVSTRIYAKLETIEDAQLAEPGPGPKFPNTTTLADQLAFLAMHDSYHIGQMAYLRKGLGHDRVIG